MVRGGVGEGEQGVEGEDDVVFGDVYDVFESWRE
jgi:hypothetical protein